MKLTLSIIPRIWGVSSWMTEWPMRRSPSARMVLQWPFCRPIRLFLCVTLSCFNLLLRLFRLLRLVLLAGCGLAVFVFGAQDLGNGLASQGRYLHRILE